MRNLEMPTSADDRTSDALEVILSCNVCQSDRIQSADPEFCFCRCDSCGYVFDSPRPSALAVAAFYSQPAKYDSWLKEEHARDALWRRRLKKMLRHRSRGNLLDVGAGIGQFLHHARDRFTQVAGTEVSASAIGIAREKYGLELYSGEAEKLVLPPAAFDNITLFHVLEHVSDPLKLLGRCRELLRPQGTVVIAVPNDALAWSSKLKKLGKRLGLKPFQKFSPVLGIARAGMSREIHLSHFTPAVLRRLVESAGLTVIEESLDPYYASRGVRLLLEKVYFTIHQTIYSLFKINRYETNWMIARKP
jgi:ubiquinone/menaquinone biosynthesis C-methylase UbiE